MPEEEAKIVEFKDGKVLVNFSKELDPNKDGEPLGGLKLSVWIDLSEVADEVLDYWKSRKED